MAPKAMKVAAAMALALGATIGIAGIATAENIGQQGCTPGYWKNHTEVWDDAGDPGIGGEPYRPTTKLYWALYNGSSAFAGAPAAVTQYQNVTMAEALSLRGGNGVDGAARILLRAATAAYLNAAHEGIGYPLRRNTATATSPSMFTLLSQALQSGDRQQMLDLAATLDANNNLGCPL